MPVIDRERWRQLEPLLDRALELSDAELQTWLGELRATSPALAAELTSLLAGLEAADESGFLERPLDLSLAGLQLGAWTLERPLGQGGMGHVWLARRADGQFEGKAAVKLLHLALGTAAGRARFRREGSVLARLTHPGIARLLDAGLGPGGQPYLVLEHVDGAPIDDYADAHTLALPQRIGLVLQVLAAVDHAHRNLIVHRDLKPSNILVDAEGRSRLLDFGIAKLLPGELDPEVSALTAQGARPHTPDFAAPEQLTGDPVTTATDVYAVGVLLYLLLTGRLPHQLAGRSAAEIERIVCAGEVRRPSEVFAGGGSASMEADAAARARARGGATPERLRRQLHGDLDAIVLQALRTDPARRYPSAGALARDLQRYLDGHPVLARPESRAYRLRKFVGRHRAGVAVAAGAVLLLAGAAVRERALRARAETEARKAGEVERFLQGVFGGADPYQAGTASGDVTARALLDRGAARVDSVLAEQPDVQSELRLVLGRVYNSLGLYSRAEPLLTRALEQRRRLYGARAPEVADVLAALGLSLNGQDKIDRAEAVLREALAQRRALLGNRDTATMHSLDDLATLLQNRSGFPEAEGLFREEIAVARAIHGPDHADVANAMSNLGVLLYLRGRFQEAEQLYRQALAIDHKVLPPEHPLTVSLLGNLAQIDQAQGRYAEAEPLYRQVLAIQRRTLGDAHPNVTIDLNNLGDLLARNMGRVDEAEPLIREAIALDRRNLGEKHNFVAEGLKNLGLVMRLKGEMDSSIVFYTQSLNIKRALYPGDNNDVAMALNALSVPVFLKGDFARAAQLQRQSVAMFERVQGTGHPNYWVLSNNLARSLRESGHVAEAEALYRAAVARLDTAQGSRRSSTLISAEAGLGLCLLDERRPTEALQHLERAFATARTKLKPTDVGYGEAALALGLGLLATGDYARAGRMLSDAESVLRPNARVNPIAAARLGSAQARLRRLAPAAARLAHSR